MNNNKKIKIGYYKFVYISNTRIIKAFKLLTNIKNFKKK